ncbi:MAG: hypothetical protein ACRDPY_28615 [Streptosporangiaceae bacterium]
MADVVGRGFKLASAYVTVELDEDQLDADIAGLNAKLGGIRDKAIGLGLDQAQVDAAIADIQAKLEALRGSAGVGISQGDLDAAIADIQAKLTALGAEKVNIRIGASGVPQTTAELGGLAAVMKAIEANSPAMVAAITGLASAEKATGDQAGGTASKIRDAAAATGLFNDYISQSLPLFVSGGAGWGFLRSHLQLFGGALTSIGMPAILGAVSGLHLLSEAVIETAGTLIPATIAFGAFGIAAVPAVQNIVTQMENLRTVSNALGVSIPGLSGGFAKAAQAVQPEVYQLFGEALVFASRNTGTFQTLATGAGKALDDLGARFVYAVSQGSGFSKFAHQATADLAMWGNNIGNLGGIIGGVIHVLPGYAGIIGNVFGAISHDVEVLVNSGLGQGFLKIGLLAHGAILYVGLLGTAFAKLAQAGLSGVASLTANLAPKLAAMGGAGRTAGLGLAAVSDAAKGAAGLPWGWISIAAAGFGFLAYQILTAKDASQQFYASLQQQAQNAPLVSLTSTLASQAAAAQQRLSAATAQGAGIAATGASAFTQQAAAMHLYRSEATVGERATALYNQALAVSTENQRENAAGLQQIGGEQSLVQSRVTALTHEYGSNAAAMALMNAAGITSAQILDTNNQHWAEALIEVNATAAAYQEMQLGQGQFAAGMNALNYSAGATSNALGGLDSSMSKMTQAESQMFSVLTGGEQGFYSFQASMIQLATGAGATSNALAKLGTTTVTNLGSQFYSTAQQGESLINALQMQGVSQAKLQPIVSTVAGEMLQYSGNVSGAKLAMVDLINGALGPGTVSLQNVDTWVGKNATSVSTMAGSIYKAMQSASGLSGVLSKQLVPEMAQALQAASGSQQAFTTFAQAVWQTGVNSGTTKTSADHLAVALYEQAGNVGKAKTAFEQYAEQGLGLTKKQADTLWQQTLPSLQREIDSLHGKNIVIAFTEQIEQQGLPGVSKGIPVGVAAPHAAGGQISGGSTRPGADDNPALLSRDEWVIQAPAVRKYGSRMFDDLNAMRYAAGGRVGGGDGAAAPAGSPVVNNHNTFLLTFEGQKPTNEEWYAIQLKLISAIGSAPS